jgi:endonuclease YncB( thermonuclease family)
MESNIRPMIIAVNGRCRPRRQLQVIRYVVDRTREPTTCYRVAMRAFRIIALGTLLLSPSAKGAPLDCAAIADRSARLLCFTAIPEIMATVGRVIDGDTIDICIGASCVRVRLCGIDAPEQGERGYSEATDALRTLVSRETIRCVPVGQGTVCDGRSRSTNRGRLVAQCFLTEADIGGALVEQGLACDWERFSGGHYRRTLNGQGCQE